jgi:methionine-rich copper-binding protein CopC
MKYKVDSKSKLIVFLLSLFVALFSFGVNPALAHNTFDSSSPSEGDALEISPSNWTITFAKSVPLDSFSGEVINGDGIRTQLTSPTHGATDNIVVVSLPTSLTGAITARWKLVSSDGHVVSGRVAFSVNTTSATILTTNPNGDIPSNSSVPETTVVSQEERRPRTASQIAGRYGHLVGVNPDARV